MSRRLKWLLLLIFVLLLPGLFWGLPTAINPQVDAPVPIGSLLFFADRRPEINTTYPAFHELFMLPFYGIAFVVYRIMGGFTHISSVWPYGLRNVSGVFSVLIFITNLMAAIMGSLLLRLSVSLTDTRKAWAWFPLLFIGTNAVFVYYSRTGNLDMPYNFWLAVMLFYIWRFLILGKALRRALVPAGIAAALAIGTKDQAVGMAMGIGVVLICFGPNPSTPFRERFRNAALFGCTLVMVYALTAVLPNAGRWWHHLVFVTGPHAPTPIPMTPYGQVQILLHTLHYVVETFTIPVLALSILGAWQMLRTGLVREFWILIAPQIGYYIVVIAKTRVAYPRFMIPFMIPVLVFSTYGVAWVANKLSRRHAQLGWSVALVAFLLFHFTVSYVPVTYAQVIDVKRQLAAELPALVRPGSPLLIARMQAVNYPNSDVYENYKLMMVPGDFVRPASRHTANLFHAMVPEVQFYLLGTGGAGLPWHKPVATPPLSGELIKEWRYPEWIRQRINVPCFFEFFLYRRTGPVPLNWVPPPDEPPDNPG